MSVGRRVAVPAWPARLARSSGRGFDGAAPLQVHADWGGYWLRPSDADALCRRRLCKIDDITARNLPTAGFFRRRRTVLRFSEHRRTPPLLLLRLLLLLLL